MADFFNTGLTQQQFLDQYWQKKPLLIRQALPNFQSPLSPEELAGLACEPEIESRLIQEFGSEGAWQLSNGPFSDEVFSELPDSHWTLLVQDVDKHVTDLASTLDPFRFIPDWRLDDLMISYAVKHGSVGPHTDGYDVFLLQAHGHRQWQIGSKPIVQPELIEGIDLRILKQFDDDEEWVLSPGDMLYLPPHVAHHGIALDDCMTFSIGFRAPKQVEILDALTNRLLEKELAEQHYQDQGLLLSQHQYEINDRVTDNLKQLLHELIDQADTPLMTAFGKLVTETKSSVSELAAEFITEQTSIEAINAEFEQGNVLTKNPYLRFAWRSDDQTATLFISGEAYTLAKEHKSVAIELIESPQITTDKWSQITHIPEVTDLFCQLLAEGVWYWQSEEV